jgi:transaldolase
VDALLDRDGRSQGQVLRGQTAIACACLAYQEYRNMIGSVRWQALAAHGAHTQRLLWASTSTKDPAYDDIMYVEALIGPDTINTLPPETLAAYRDHGNPALRLEEHLHLMRALPGQLAALGLDLNTVSEELERQGVQKFIEPYERLLVTLARRANELVNSGG